MKETIIAKLIHMFMCPHWAEPDQMFLGIICLDSNNNPLLLWQNGLLRDGVELTIETEQSFFSIPDSHLIINTPLSHLFSSFNIIPLTKQQISKKEIEKLFCCTIINE